MTGNEERYPDEVNLPLLHHFTRPSHYIKILVRATRYQEIGAHDESSLEELPDDQ